MSNVKIFKHLQTGQTKIISTKFSFIAFFFPLLWLLFNGIWGLFFVFSFFAWGGSLLFAAAGNSNDIGLIWLIFIVIAIFELSMRIYLGKNASKLKEEKLISKGFIETNTIAH